MHSMRGNFAGLDLADQTARTDVSDVAICTSKMLWSDQHVAPGALSSGERPDLQALSPTARDTCSAHRFNHVSAENRMQQRPADLFRACNSISCIQSVTIPSLECVTYVSGKNVERARVMGRTHAETAHAQLEQNAGSQCLTSRKQGIYSPHR